MNLQRIEDACKKYLRTFLFLELNKMKYAEEHGEYEVSRSKQTILFAGRGPWNDETLRRGTEVIGGIIKQLDFTMAWGGLSCLFGESLMPPSAYRAFEEQTHYRKKIGMTALAVVIQDSEITNTIQNQLSAAYQSAEIDYVFLPSVEQAMAWLLEKGIIFDNQEVLTFFQQKLLMRAKQD